jgi:uncharacterized protein
MQHWEDEDLSMEEAVDAIRRVFAEQDASDNTLNTTGRPDIAKKLDTTTEAGLLSREATAAVTSSVSRLAENVKKREASLEDVVSEALRPVLKSWVEENLPDLVQRMLQAEIARVIRGG